ncbi:MAG TPA: M48 family metalloprotease [Methylococcaceae bacterium]|nr:M48 family metalloprotease [Methylococcaceae bacterium]
MKKFLSWVVLSALLGATLAAMGDELLLPEIGDPTGTLFTPDQERELGEAFFRSLHNQVQISEDPEITDYIQSIGQKLATNSDNPEQNYTFFIVVSPDINAFAGPGGYIGVNSGLLLTSESESELASVLAHEIAHVTQRHLYQAFDAAKKMSIPSAAAMLGAILLGTQSPQLGQAALIAAQAGMVQMQINFTRDNEQEADRVGMQTLSRSEFDPRAMPLFFERLQQSTRYVGRELPEFLRTHPVTVSRISDTRARSESFPYRQYPDSMGYQLARARLKAEAAGDAEETLRYFRASVGQGTPAQRDVARYGLALTLLGRNKTAEARPLLEPLVAKYPEYPQFINALARMELAAARHEKALALYGQALSRFPGNRAVLIEYSKAQLAAGNAELARKSLLAYLRDHQVNAETNQLLAEAYTKLGNESEGHRYMAEYYYLNGQTRAAITQLRIAAKAARGNFYLYSMVDERLRQLEAEEEERRKARGFVH